MLFDGIFEEGKPDGKGKEYRFDGSLAFEGEFVKGERTGRGLVFGTDGSKLFDGNFIKGSREGEEQNTRKWRHSFQRVILKDQHMV